MRNVPTLVHMYARGGLEVLAIDAAVSKTSRSVVVCEGRRDARLERRGHPRVQLVRVLGGGLKMESDALLEDSAISEPFAWAADVGV